MRGVQALTCYYFSYFSGVPADETLFSVGNERVLLSFPTNDGLTCVLAGMPNSRFHEYRADIEGQFFASLELLPELAERVRGGRREERWQGTADLPNFFRRPYGPGWALVGDAAYHKDPIGAHGISDAFRDAERLAQAVHAGLTGEQDMALGLAGCQGDRDDTSMALFELNSQLATLEPPPAELQALIGALATNQAETERFIGALCGTVPVPEFFAPANLARISGAPAERIA